jgi:hypothetical protein
LTIRKEEAAKIELKEVFEVWITWLPLQEIRIPEKLPCITT